MFLYPPDAIWWRLRIIYQYAPAERRDFPVTLLEPKVFVSNLQDMSISTKACLGLFLASFWKTRWPPWPFDIIKEDIYSTVTNDCRDFPIAPLEQKGIIGRGFKFAGFVHHYKNWPWNIFWPHFEKSDGRHGHFFESHQGVLEILRLFSHQQKLEFLYDWYFNRYMCPL